MSWTDFSGWHLERKFFSFIVYYKKGDAPVSRRMIGQLRTDKNDTAGNTCWLIIRRQLTSEGRISSNKLTVCLQNTMTTVKHLGVVRGVGDAGLERMVEHLKATCRLRGITLAELSAAETYKLVSGRCRVLARPEKKERLELLKRLAKIDYSKSPEELMGSESFKLGSMTVVLEALNKAANES